MQHQAKLIVEDNGDGIPIEAHEKVFERFYLVLGMCQTNDGFGLGMDIAQDVIKLHQG